ncbi:hypothetical protein KR018_011641 [Drosophila ironensis]|nr:hypothetical protein KR018_011641 [Drosophila ironensis]
MFDWVGWLLGIGYYYGHFLGVSNFQWDWKTGRVFTTARCTLYAVTSNLLVVFLLILFCHGSRNNLNPYLGTGNLLQQNVIIVIAGLKILTGIATLFIRWQKRWQIMELYGTVLKIYLARPQVKQMINGGVLSKFLVAIMSDFVQIIYVLGEFDRLNSGEFLACFLHIAFSAIQNFSISQYYVIMLFIRGHYQLLNSDLRHLVDESRALSCNPPRSGIFMTKCCFLADKLDEFGQNQSQLQSQVIRLGELFEIQGLMGFAGYYFSSVATNYNVYSVAKHGPTKLGLTQRSIILSLIWILFYYVDAFQNLYVMLYVQDEYKITARILEERTLFATKLDVRLEESFEKIQIQIKRNPLHMRVMQMFSVSRATLSAMLGSILMNSIYLIQYDMENF